MGIVEHAQAVIDALELENPFDTRAIVADTCRFQKLPRRYGVENIPELRTSQCSSTAHRLYGQIGELRHSAGQPRSMRKKYAAVFLIQFTDCSVLNATLLQVLKIVAHGIVFRQDLNQEGFRAEKVVITVGHGEEIVGVSRDYGGWLVVAVQVSAKWSMPQLLKGGHGVLGFAQYRLLASEHGHLAGPISLELSRVRRVQICFVDYWVTVVPKRLE